MTAREDRAQVFALVFALAQHLDRRGDEALAPFGLTTKQWLLLAVLSRGVAGPEPTLSQAAAAYGSSRQNVRAMVEQLARRGFIELVPDPRDRRSVRLRLTDRVAEFDTVSWREREASTLDDLFAGLSDTDVRRLRAGLTRWADHVVPAAPGGTR